MSSNRAAQVEEVDALSDEIDGIERALDNLAKGATRKLGEHDVNLRAAVRRRLVARMLACGMIASKAGIEGNAIKAR